MRKFFRIIRPQPGQETEFQSLRALWRIVTITGLGCCIGGLGLFFAATAYVKLHSWALLFSYLSNPLILFLNLLPAVLLIWFFYFLSRRAWVGFLGGFLPVVGLSLVNYFKIRLRSDPVLAVDLRLAAEAGGIVGGYTLDLTWLVWFAVGCLVVGLLFAILLIPKATQDHRDRAFGALSCLALMAVAFVSLYINPQIYQKTANNDYINQWSDVEVYVSKGCVYPFLYSFRDMFPTPPAGYDEQKAQELLSSYGDADIPEDKKVSVLSVMLEAYCDLTDFAYLAEQENVARVYAPWHALEEQSVSGDLLTNIFAGGTVDSEWGFLTGYTTHDDFRSPTDSYVWYLKNQGYRTVGGHPGFGWFYNRQNVNRYLGFDEYQFTENYYGQLVDPTAAQWNSDHILMEDLLKQMQEETAKGPCFSFSVTYQNHGPSDGTSSPEAYLTPEDSGLTEETCHIFNNYLKGVEKTISAVENLVQGLEEMEEPVVLVLFGDHKPWAGNGNSAYANIGLDFDLSTIEGFTDYYSTPYLIWANAAAKEALDKDFVGPGGDFSPCFLMTEVFDQCGWEGPGFMQLSRELREISPLIHSQNLFLQNGLLVNALEEEEMDFFRRFLSAQYYRETEILPNQ